MFEQKFFCECCGFPIDKSRGEIIYQIENQILCQECVDFRCSTISSILKDHSRILKEKVAEKMQQRCAKFQENKSRKNTDTTK